MCWVMHWQQALLANGKEDWNKFVYQNIIMNLFLLAFEWHQLLQPQFYIEHGGLWLLLFVVFAETGLFAGFFLPGDSLLFVAGIYCHEGVNGKPGLAYEFLQIFGLQNFNNEWIDLFVLITLISIAGIVGNSIGYWFGKKVGPAMYQWDDNFLFKKNLLVYYSTLNTYIIL